ncbi:hypothetical protein Acid345_0929 [Candidatus Koribacter versatilis Ellin345]|uniref:Transmembrane protein n=1 Tax=Koribacter versatilis (strain Ellin345) TaxID=204669 RepID=Q1IT68_KORVE|nr:hypothetical protein [Candidatus Koribacter versatilis]ABF39932.1 hypothetical protein Acid345_0929 [Candidatus Koribacter versatilis Ellin345]
MIRNAIAILRSGRVLGLHLVGNALLLVAASLWLLLPEAHVWQLIITGVCALAILFLALWLHTSTLEYAANPGPENFRIAFRPSFLRMLWLFLGVAVLFLLMWYVDRLTDRQYQIADYLYAKMPPSLRPKDGASVYYARLGVIISIVFWFLLPSLMLPLIAARVIGARVRAGLKTLIRWRYWLAMIVTVCVGVWLTTVLLNWKPGKSLSAQEGSLIFRMALGYLLATTSWLTTAGLLGYFVRTNSDIVGNSAPEPAK